MLELIKIACGDSPKGNNFFPVRGDLFQKQADAQPVKMAEKSRRTLHLFTNRHKSFLNPISYLGARISAMSFIS